MAIFTHQLAIVILLSIATAKFGWLGCGIAAFLAVAATFAGVRKPGLRLLQLATIAGTAYLLWPGFDAVPAATTAETSLPGWLPWLGYSAVALFGLIVAFAPLVGRGKPAEPAGLASDCSYLNTYLNVPFAEKNAAKALGARWDPELRAWYVPANTPRTPFSRWKN